MSKLKDYVKEALVEIDHVEETAEGQLKGGFSLLSIGKGDSTDKVNILICVNNSNCGECNTADCNNTSESCKTTAPEGEDGLIHQLF